MKQLERRITYRWWRDDGDINDNHIEALEESAMHHIAGLITEGCSSGQLQDAIRVADDDPGSETEYMGWWDISAIGDEVL